MPLHPIAVIDRVIEEYRGHVLTEFRARDEKLRQALEEALDRPLFLAQEPFFQAHRPFKDGKAWRELGLDPALARAMENRASSKTAYLHQSEAIEHLLSHDARGLVVTTGTGSGKTECFLLPVIQNAIEDAVRFKRDGLTALLVYPMNALANDQEERIAQLLDASGHGHVRVARYDRSTPQAERQALRERPPHVLLTNYVMLEYLLVRPGDRDAIFANHRCRFVVLDEVHTYRGSLGTNIALLFRRLRAHLAAARHDWAAEDRTDRHRFPHLVPIATSATIKSTDEAGRPAEEVRKAREEAVTGFLSKLTGVEAGAFRVIGEAYKGLDVPAAARWPAVPADVPVPPYTDREAVRRTLARLAGLPGGTPIEKAAESARILWTLNELLVQKPLSVSGIVDAIRARVPERAGANVAAVRREIEAALATGAALPDGTKGVLRLRVHRFIRGGWRFHRCLNPACGKLHPMGEGECACGYPTAPLYLCRACGADGLGFVGPTDPTTGPLRPGTGDPEGRAVTWLLYERDRHADEDADDDWAVEDLARKQMKRRPVVSGSFDPKTLSFAREDDLYPMKVTLAPARNTCLVCGSSAGRGAQLTLVSLGTSAAVRVVTEGLVEGLSEQRPPETDGQDRKERVLIFADSRQDAAHQARFITYAGRYDRMRRRLLEALETGSGRLTFDEAVRALVVAGVQHGDNPHTARYHDVEFLPGAVQSRASAWEEAPLLDDVAVSAGYRATVFNLGLVGLQYPKLANLIEKRGAELARALGIGLGRLVHVARCVLDEMRTRRAFARPLLCCHPSSPNCPEDFRAHADWERRIKTPQGYPWEGERPVGWIEDKVVPDGVNLNNAWRRPGLGGRDPRLARRFKHLVARSGGAQPGVQHLRDLLEILTEGFIRPSKLSGYKKVIELIQVDPDSVVLELVKPEDRRRCSVCNVRMPWAAEGAPCPACNGSLQPWPEEEVEANRYVRRLRKRHVPALVAGEHTAQVTGDARIELEKQFKAPLSESPINVLACSPTLEMGIDVGGLDAVVMRNVPPRPDNYAQRGGRAGRRTRIGVVAGYARATPHDGYFYDKPGEMIAGEIAVPALGLGNRDVLVRHLNAIALGLATPGLAGRMYEYIGLKGEPNVEQIDAFVKAFEDQADRAARVALDAWGPDVLAPAGLETYEKLRAALAEQSARIRDVFDRVRRQIIELDNRIKQWSELGTGQRAAVTAMTLKKRLLGLRDETRPGVPEEADDRSGGHPMRRFAEFGLLPGYEFPSEPATLRLLGDEHEEEPISVERRFGLAQYQPEAPAHARGHRWRVVGLDMTSPWNPRSEEPDWTYVICPRCGLRYGAQDHVGCPRCGAMEAGKALPGFEFGGFLAVRSDTPVLDEEERIPIAALLQCHPQRNGEVTARYGLATGWRLELRRGEDIRWINEWKPPTEAGVERDDPVLHPNARGFYLCPSCGRILTVPKDGADGQGKKKGGRTKAKRVGDTDAFGHASGCSRTGEKPTPLAITTKTASTTLRIVVTLPFDMPRPAYRRWGLSLGYALRTGMRQLYMLDGPEIEFELEPMFDVHDERGPWKVGTLTFIDAAVGGSGFLDRAAAEMDQVARRTCEHLDHPNCESACYRCLLSYRNQRYHADLSWPGILPDLEQLAEAAPEPLRPEVGDVHDPRPWLEAYDAGVGSPLELRFLRLFEQLGIEVDKQVPVSPDEGGKPISTADFVVRGKRIAIYVDGAAFHRGDRLRRDRYVRAKLRAGTLGWTVVEVRQADLNTAALRAKVDSAGHRAGP